MRAADEQPHDRGESPSWSEWYSLDFVADDGSYGGYIDVVLVPARAQSWYFAALAGRDRQTTIVAVTDAPLPRLPSLELRWHGLWQDLVVETPFEHVSVGLEAFGVGLDDPAEALAGDDMRGDRVPLGFELDWYTADGERPTRDAASDGYAVSDGYALPCRVQGEVLVGPERLELDGVGYRSHRWGTDLWSTPWTRERGRALAPAPPASGAADIPTRLPEPAASGVLWRHYRADVSSAAWQHRLVVDPR